MHLLCARQCVKYFEYVSNVVRTEVCVDVGLVVEVRNLRLIIFR